MSDQNFVAYGDAETVLTAYANRMKLSPTEFVGTQAEWNALSAADKAKYTLVNLTDDGETGAEDTYTTTEQNTGKKWIDGKPIYRRVVSYTATGSFNNTTITIPATLSNLDVVTSILGTYKTPYSTVYNYPLALGTGSGDLGSVTFGRVDDTSIQIRVGGSQSFSDATFSITVEYTKTTD